MRDWIFRLRVLAAMLADTYRAWRCQYVGVDLDAPYCCSGTPQMECGCQGTTLREMWDYRDQ